jgi:hypothetical protein
MVPAHSSEFLPAWAQVIVQRRAKLWLGRVAVVNVVSQEDVVTAHVVIQACSADVLTDIGDVVAYQ